MSILHEPLTVNRLTHEYGNRKTSVAIHNSTVYQDVVCVIDGLEREQDILYHMEKYKRVALCVNACQGLTDEALEKNLVDRGVRYLWDEYEEASCSLDDDMETSVWEDES